MSAKSIFIIIVTIVLTIILMKNTDDVTFWLFSNMQAPKLAVMAGVYAIGLITGLLLRRSKKSKVIINEHSGTIDNVNTNETYNYKKENTNLSDEDRDYIS